MAEYAYTERIEWVCVCVCEPTRIHALACAYAMQHNSKLPKAMQSTMLLAVLLFVCDEATEHQRFPKL